MTGVGPYQMAMADWVFLGALRSGLVPPPVTVVGPAVFATRSPR
jgi:hypothetical protein